MLKIYIPTLGRVGKQRTYKNLSPKWRKRAILVVPPEEATAHGDIPVLVTPKDIRGIGPTRQYILDTANTDKLVMLDDDLRFDTRRSDAPNKFVPSTPADVDAMFAKLDEVIGKAHPHGSITAREGGNRYTTAFLHNTRMLRALAYHVPTFRKHGFRYDRLPVMEDFDVTLQMLRAGLSNIVINNWVQGQNMSGADGGCSTYRDMKMQAAGAMGLKKLHPDFVTVVEKTTKNAWGGATRLDVIIGWKKAYESAA